MANAVNSIEVMVDTEKLAADVAKAIQEQMTNFARDLRYVADILDKGDFWKHEEEYREGIRKEAFEAGKASRD